jgi:outer membrane protein, heavy metal efflux system
VHIIPLSFICAFFLANIAYPAPQTLPELVQVAFQNNPKVHAARLTWRASIKAIPQAHSLPDPMLRFDYFGESVQTRVGPQETRIGLSQSFPFPGTLDQASEVATRGARIQELAYQIALRDTIVNLKIAYFELLYLRNAITISTKNQALLSQIAALANAQDAKLQDRLKAEAQQAQLSYDLVALGEQEQLAVAQLNALLNRPSEATIEIVWPELRSPQLEPEAIEAAALETRQELLLARAKVAKLAAVVDLTVLKNRPAFTVSATHIDVDGGEDPWMLGVGVSLPIWRDRNESRVAEAQLTAESAELESGSLENETRVAVRSAFYKLQNARRLTLLYQETLIPQARAGINLAQQWEAGDVSALLDTQAVWQRVQLARLRALIDHQQHVARLEQLVGGPLPSAPVITAEAVEELPESPPVAPPAQNPPTPAWLADNPDVQAAAAKLAATRTQISQADALMDILRQYKAFGAAAMSPTDFPFPATSTLKGKLVSQDIAIAQEMLAVARRDAAAAMRSARLELAFVDDSIAINREQRSLLEQMIAVAQTKVRTERGDYQGLVMAQVELSKLADTLITLKETRETLVARINALLNRPPERTLDPTGPPVAESAKTLEAWYEAALADRQELRVQQLRLARTETMIELGRQMAANSANQPWFGVRMAFVSELQQERAAHAHALTAIENHTRVAVKNAHFALERATRSLALHRDSLLPKTEQALDAAATGYRAGRVDFSDFLDAERTLLALRLEAQRARRDQGLAQTKLDKLSGVIR